MKKSFYELRKNVDALVLRSSSLLSQNMRVAIQHTKRRQELRLRVDSSFTIQLLWIMHMLWTLKMLRKGAQVLLMEEILHQLVGSLWDYLQVFLHPRWCRVSSINSMIWFVGMLIMWGKEVFTSQWGFLTRMNELLNKSAVSFVPLQKGLVCCKPWIHLIISDLYVILLK